ITVQPVNITQCETTNAVFSVTAAGTTLRYLSETGVQACVSPISVGASTSTYTKNGIATADNGNRYRVTVTSGGACGNSVVSNAGVLAVQESREVAVETVNTSACVSGTAVFTATAGATTGAAYQWQVDTGSGFGNIAAAGAA